MPSVGPSLPPHLAKRSREDEDNDSSSEKRVRIERPAPPRVQGPAPPPAPLSERPAGPTAVNSDTSDSDDDDDFGPAPPPPGAQPHPYEDDEGHHRRNKATPSVFDSDPKFSEETKTLQRDDWMTMPPTQDDLAARMDPTKMRARKFNTGKSAGGASMGGDMGIWTETPEQKLKRLQNEALGVVVPAHAQASDIDKGSKYRKEEDEKIRRIKHRVEAARGKSLMDQHREKGTGKDKEDDPSKRGFDWEKDMGGGMKIGHKQRNEMLNKAKGFGDRFSSGNFL